ncbi:MAG: ferritin [Spartobacteria bacterium]|nr:ferritin [Spartobacteria bacterium]
MISDTMTKALNKQINNELYSAYLYFSMSAFCSSEGYKGAANWFYIQTMEEMTHAKRIYDYVNSRGGRAIMQAIAEPPASFDSYEKLFEDALKHEQFITQCFNELMELAREEKDHATQIELQWFVTEQVEEEENVTDILGELKLSGGDKRALLMIDRDLAARVFTPPATNE